jgi:hypothetical protein
MADSPQALQDLAGAAQVLRARPPGSRMRRLGMFRDESRSYPKRSAMMIQSMSDDVGLQQALSAAPPHAFVAGRLRIVEQLMGDLETATHGGQHYTMAKIVGLLREETADDAARLSELQRRSLRRSLEELAREEERMLPDRIAFLAGAQKIADVLSIC